MSVASPAGPGPGPAGAGLDLFTVVPAAAVHPGAAPASPASVSPGAVPASPAAVVPGPGSPGAAVPGAAVPGAVPASPDPVPARRLRGVTFTASAAAAGLPPMTSLTPA